MRYPLGAPLLLTVAGSAIMTGTLLPPWAAVCFAWVVPLSFLGLALVMLAASGWKLDMPSALMILGGMLSLHKSLCGILDDGSLFQGAICPVDVPPLLPALLAVSGPALLISRFGPDDPILLCWLGSTVVGLIPVLPLDYQHLIWQPGVASALLILTQAWLMLRTRWGKPRIPVSEKDE